MMPQLGLIQSTPWLVALGQRRFAPQDGFLGARSTSYPPLSPDQFVVHGGRCACEADPQRLGEALGAMTHR